MFNTVDDIINNPKVLYGKTKEDVAKILDDSWTEGTYGSSKTGWMFMKDDQRIVYHPGGGRHGGKYWIYSSGKTGCIKIIGDDYVAEPNKKAIMIRGN